MDDLLCKKPDRDVPGIVCGYPLPCPWHTDAVIEVKADGEAPEIRLSPKAQLQASPKDIQRLDQVGRALSPRRRRRRRKQT